MSITRLAYIYPHKNGVFSATRMRAEVRTLTWEFNKLTRVSCDGASFVVTVDCVCADRVGAWLRSEGFIIRNGKGRGGWGERSKEWVFMVNMPQIATLAGHMSPDPVRA